MLSKKLFLASVLFFVLFTLPLIGSVYASSELWSRTYGGPDIDYAEAMVETSDGGYTLIGYTTSFGAESWDVWLVKTDMDGNMEWNQTYGGANNDEANSLVETSDGGYAIAGTTNSFGAGKDDFWLVKTDSQGIPEFPSWAILPLLFVASFAAIMCKQRIDEKIS